MCKEKQNGKSDLDTIIWRYMSLETFIKMLGNGQNKDVLYFNALRNMSDPFEGFPLPTASAPIDWSGFGIPKLGSIIELKHFLYISSWSMYEKENLLLWEKFSGVNGIAIKSTVSKIENALNANKNQVDKKIAVRKGKVNYCEELPNEIFQKIKSTSKKQKSSLILPESYKNNTEVDYFKTFIFTKHIDFLFENEFRFFFGHKEFGWQLKLGIPMPIGTIGNIADEIKVNPLSGEKSLKFVQTILKGLGMDSNKITQSKVKDICD